jgi:hypothetical protein
MLYFGRIGSLWGHYAFFSSSWGEKVITPKKKKKEFITNHSLNDNISFGNVKLRKMVIKTLKW